MKTFFANVVKTITEWMNPVKDWLVDNHRNPLLWIGLAVIVFGIIAIIRSSNSGK